MGGRSREWEREQGIRGRGGGEEGKMRRGGGRAGDCGRARAEPHTDTREKRKVGPDPLSLMVMLRQDSVGITLMLFYQQGSLLHSSDTAVETLSLSRKCAHRVARPEVISEWEREGEK